MSNNNDTQPLSDTEDEDEAPPQPILTGYELRRSPVINAPKMLPPLEKMSQDSDNSDTSPQFRSRS